MKTIVLYNNKGGVAKTMTCVNLADIWARKGCRVLLVDLDPQANSTHFFLKDKTTYPITLKQVLDSADPHTIEDAIYPADDVSNLFIAPAEADLDDTEVSMMMDSMVKTAAATRFYLARQLDHVKDRFDIAIIDTHPSKKRLLNINGLVASDYLYIPVDADPESFEGMNGLLETYRECLDLNPKLRVGGVIYTKYRETKVDRQAVMTLMETLQYPDGTSMLLDTAIPLRTKANETRWAKVPLMEYDAEDACAQAYVQLADEMEERMGGLR